MRLRGRSSIQESRVRVGRAAVLPAPASRACQRRIWAARRRAAPCACRRAPPQCCRPRTRPRGPRAAMGTPAARCSAAAPCVRAAGGPARTDVRRVARLGQLRSDRSTPCGKATSEFFPSSCGAEESPCQRLRAPTLQSGSDGQTRWYTDWLRQRSRPVTLPQASLALGAALHVAAHRDDEWLRASVAHKHRPILLGHGLVRERGVGMPADEGYAAQEPGRRGACDERSISVQPRRALELCAPRCWVRGPHRGSGAAASAATGAGHTGTLPAHAKGALTSSRRKPSDVKQLRARSTWCPCSAAQQARDAARVPRAGWGAGAHGGEGHEEAELPAGRRALDGLEQQHGAQLLVSASAAAKLASLPPRLRLVSLPLTGVESRDDHGQPREAARAVSACAAA
jgi:hypothetical protein